MNTEAKQIVDLLRNPVRLTHREANGYPISEPEALQAMVEAADLIESQAQRIAELESEISFLRVYAGIASYMRLADWLAVGGTIAQQNELEAYLAKLKEPSNG